MQTLNFLEPAPVKVSFEFYNLKSFNLNDMEMDIDLNDLTDEQYVVKRAKMELKLDPYSAKAWMITAKTLYPHNFSVQVISSQFIYFRISGTHLL